MFSQAEIERQFSIERKMRQAKLDDEKPVKPVEK